eukprot:2365171-Ditylum_brightwellii.AAC.1
MEDFEKVSFESAIILNDKADSKQDLSIAPPGIENGLKVWIIDIIEYGEDAVMPTDVAVHKDKNHITALMP